VKKSAIALKNCVTINGGVVYENLTENGAILVAAAINQVGSTNWEKISAILPLGIFQNIPNTDQQ
jgi:hypothetical protein